MSVETSEMVQVDGARLSAEVHGTVGPYVTLINGHTRPKTDFRSLVKQLVADGLRCLIFDNRGAGTTVESDSSFLLSQMVADVDKLWQHFGVERSSLVGISMGGIISQHVAWLYQQKVEKLVLISTTCQQQWLADQLPWSSHLAGVEAKLQQYVAPAFFQKNKLLMKAMAKQIIKQNQGADGHFAQRAEAQRQAINSYDTTAILPKINTETLLIHGAKDQIILAGVLEVFKGFWPDAQSHLYEENGHLLLAEAPRRLFADISEFLTDAGD